MSRYFPESNIRVEKNEYKGEIKLNVHSLPIYFEEEIIEKSKEPSFFEKNDFIIFPKSLYRSMRNEFGDGALEFFKHKHERRNCLSERGLVALKLGNLYIEYDCGGKGLFDCKVYLLDFVNRQSKLICFFQKERYCLPVKFNDLLPFVPLYSATHVGEDFGQLTKNSKLQANAVRASLMKMACGETVDIKEFGAAYRAFINAFSVAAERYQHNNKTVKRVAEKLAKKYYSEPEIYTIKSLAEFLRIDAKAENYVINVRFFNLLYNYPLEGEKYTLKMLTDFELTTEVCNKICHYIETGKWIDEEKIEECIDESKANAETEFLTIFSQKQAQQAKSDKSEEKEEVKEQFVPAFRLTLYQQVRPDSKETRKINEFKQSIRNCIVRAVAPNGLFYQFAKEMMIISTNNMSYVKKLEALVTDDKYYSNFQNCYSIIVDTIDEIKPFITRNLYKDLQAVKERYQEEESVIPLFC